MQQGPGAIFELTLAAWLLTKGFTKVVFDAPPTLDWGRGPVRTEGDLV